MVRLAPARPRALPALASAGAPRQLPGAAGAGGAKAHWGAVHHPVEDVGTGTVHARIEFLPPSEFGFSNDGLGDPAVGTIVCGLVGDDRKRLRHTAMAHVFLREGDGLVLRSRFWLGARIRPYLPGALGDVGERR